MFNHYHKWHPPWPPRVCHSRRPFHHSTLIVLRLGCLALRWGMARGERNLAQGKRRGLEETVKTVKEQAKGLYRKSIRLSQFFRRLAAKGQSQGLSARGTIQAFFPSQVNSISFLLCEKSDAFSSGREHLQVDKDLLSDGKRWKKFKKEREIK